MSDRAARSFSRHLPWPEVPTGWTVIRTRGPWPFITHALLQDPDGNQVEWTSRRHRKRLPLRPGDPAMAPTRRVGRGRPSPMSWMLGVLFMVGAACFALGSLPPYFNNVDPALVATTFFVGSLFFTTAAYLQYHESVRAPRRIDPEAPRLHGIRAYIGWQPHRIDWWASLIQLGGTVFFNVSTFAATRTDFTLQQEQHLIWTPDVLGSICFLIASWLAYSEVTPRFWSRPDWSVEWTISALNLAGSVAFGVAAVAARYVATTGEPANIALVNLGTFVGALCFLLGAALLPVESAEQASSS